MKSKFLSVLILVFALPLYSQGINFINTLGEKKVATYDDALQIFMMEMGKPSGGFTANKRYLDRYGITIKMDYKKDHPLRRGILCKMIARYLDIKDSLFYLIFKTERYAFRACASRGLMDANNSEWDKLSGEELLEIMLKVSDFKDKEKEVKK